MEQKITNTELRTDYIHLYSIEKPSKVNKSATVIRYYFHDGLECLDNKFIVKQTNGEYITDEDIQKAREYSSMMLKKQNTIKVKKSKKITATEALTERLKQTWMSNWQIQQYLQSSSGDRIMRRIRSNPPFGYVMESRPKKVPEGYNKCLEYRLTKIEV